MPRQDVPYQQSAICRLRERIAELFDLVGEKMKSINGVQGDGQGNVTLKSGDPAIVINNDQAQHEVEIGFNAGLMVTSVNGQVGDVDLDAADIKSEVLATDNTVEDDLNGLNAKFTDGSVTKVGTSNVGTDTKPIKLVGGVPTAVTNDLVDTATAQTISGAKTFSTNPTVKNGLGATDGYITAPSRAYNSANTNDIVTIGSLAANPSVIHATGNETKSGNLTEIGSIYLATSSSVIPTRIYAYSDSNGTRTLFRTDNTDANLRAQLEIKTNSNNTIEIVLQKRTISPDAQVSSTTIATL